MLSFTPQPNMSFLTTLPSSKVFTSLLLLVPETFVQDAVQWFPAFCVHAQIISNYALRFLFYGSSQ